MKTILSFLTLILTYCIGAIAGTAAGFNPVVSGGVFTGLSFLAVSPNGSLRTGLDVTQVVTQLNAYIQINQKQIWNKVRQGLELVKYMSIVKDVTGKYSTLNSDTTDLHQAYQKGLQFKGEASIVPFLNTNFHVKADVLIDNIHTLYNGWLTFLTSEETTPDKYPFRAWVINEVFIPKLIEEQNDLHCRGVYIDPATHVGVAGTTLGAMNGLFTIVTDLITAGDLTVTTVGAMDATNGVEKVEAFMAAIPEKYKTRGGTIFTSMGKQRAYVNRYRTLYLNSGLKDDRNNTMVDGETNTSIVGLAGAGSANRMIYVPGNSKDKLIQMVNKIATPDSMTAQLQGRDILLLHDRWDGVGFNNLDGIFVSDIA